MKTIRLFTGLLFIVSAICISCQDDETLPLLEPKVSQLDFKAEGEEIYFQFDCNLHWKLECDADWLHLSAKRGTGKGIVAATCEKNQLTVPRSTEIKIFAEDKTETIKVTQASANSVLHFKTTTTTVKAEGEIIDIPFESNVAFTLDTKVSWIERMVSADIPDTLIRLRVFPNYTLSDRQEFVVASETDGILKDSIKLQQTFCINSAATDSLALTALYTSTGGNQWIHSWDINQPFNTWYGITTAVIDDQIRVTAIGLWENNLTGNLPEELSYLSELTSFHVGDNHLDGPVPLCFTQLKRLELLALQGNNLEGNLPAGLGNLPVLSALYLDNNRLTGEIPEDILGNSHWSDWKTSNFCQQQEGYGFTNCDQGVSIETVEKNILIAFYESTNGNSWNQKWDLDAPVSEWYGVTTETIDGHLRVTELRLWENNLSGEFPSELGDLSECRMIHVGGNQISGELPGSLGKMQKLEMLAIQNNLFSGSIPAEIGGLSNLVNFYIDNNQFSGIIPDEILNNPNWGAWRDSGFCNQKAGFGFSNCP